jgi:hypothetical protein
MSPKKEVMSMSIGVYFSPPAMSAAQYDECMKLLKKAGAGNPAGRSYHSAFGPKDKLMIFDIWTSPAAFEKFGKKLMPILQQIGVDPGQPMVMPIHKVVLPAPKGALPKKAAATKTGAKTTVAKKAGAKKIEAKKTGAKPVAAKKKK